MRTVKTQIVFPEDLLEELDRAVKKRERSDFVIQAVEDKLQKLRLEQALQRASGIWKHRKDMRTDGQVRKYLKQLRGADTRRKRRLQKAWHNG